jgi:hypothetical protein
MLVKHDHVTKAAKTAPEVRPVVSIPNPIDWCSHVLAK